jgi:hypothetical protein
MNYELRIMIYELRIMILNCRIHLTPVHQFISLLPQEVIKKSQNDHHGKNDQNHYYKYPEQ